RLTEIVVGAAAAQIGKGEFALAIAARRDRLVACLEQPRLARDRRAPAVPTTPLVVDELRAGRVCRDACAPCRGHDRANQETATPRVGPTIHCPSVSHP